MAIKKDNIKEDIKEEKKPAQYFYAVGKRKTAVARVKLFLSEKEQESLTVNERNLAEYFPVSRLEESVKAPLLLAGEGKKFDALIGVSGGGLSAQADAIRLGISRALVIYDESLKKILKGKGYLTRDSRKVERKKPGLKKARRAPQWAKR